MDNTLEQLARYVSQQLRQGISEQNIRTSLAQNRWTPDWIDAAFNVVHQDPARFQTPAPQQVQNSTSMQPVASPSSYSGAQPAQSQPKQASNTLQVAIISIIIFICLAIGAFFFFQSQSNKTSKQGATTQEDKKPKAPNDQRKDDLNTLLSDIADFFVTNGFYPTYDVIKTPEFAAQNPTFDTSAFADPKWSADNAACTAAGKAILAAKPTANCYAYGVVSPDGAACDNVKIFCLRMTIVTTLDDGKPYAITLERNTEIED
ncbi:MAG: hypothetical protein ABWX94_03190 [Candidatus Saccharimonadales bacterium]